MRRGNAVVPDSPRVDVPVKHRPSYLIADRKARMSWDLRWEQKHRPFPWGDGKKQGIYIFGSKKFGWYKIGVSIDVDSRFRTIANSVPFQIEQIAFFPTKSMPDSFSRERYLHARFADH